MQRKKHQCKSQSQCRVIDLQIEKIKGRKAMKRKKLCVCQYCIQEMKSRGEKIFIGDIVIEEKICEWCGEEDDDLREIEFC